MPKEEHVSRSPGLLLTIALLLTVSAGFSASASVQDPDVVPFSDRYPVRISIPGHSSVYDLAGLGIDIDAVGQEVVNTISAEELEGRKTRTSKSRRSPKRSTAA